MRMKPPSGPKKTKPNKANLESTLKSNAILDDIKYGKFVRCCKRLIYKIILFRDC